MNRRAWLLLTILAAVWGSSYLFIKVALDDGVPPVFVVFSRVALGAAVLAALAVRSGALREVRAHHRRPIAALSLMQVVGPFLLIAYGEQHIASSLTGIIVAATPIFTALIAARVDQEERPRGIAAAGVVVGIVGVGLLFGVDLSGDGKALLGGLMVLLAALGYGAGALFLKHRLRDVPTLGLAASTMIVATLTLLPAALVELPSATPSLAATASLLALGAGGTGLAFAIFYTLIAGVGPSRAALVTYIALGYAVLYGVWLLGEPLTAGGILGLILILCGSWLAAEGRIPGRRGASAEADLAVGARSRLGALDEVQALDRRLEQPCDQP